MNVKAKPSTWFWIVAVIAILWNLMGVIQYLGKAFMTPEMAEKLTEQQRMYYENMPAWATAAFATAVFGGLLGSLALLLRKKISLMLLTISFFAVLVQSIYSFFLSEVIFGGGDLVMGVLIPLFALALIGVARSSIKKGWI